MIKRQIQLVSLCLILFTCSLSAQEKVNIKLDKWDFRYQLSFNEVIFDRIFFHQLEGLYGVTDYLSVGPMLGMHNAGFILRVMPQQGTIPPDDVQHDARVYQSGFLVQVKPLNFILKREQLKIEPYFKSQSLAAFAPRTKFEVENFSDRWDLVQSVGGGISIRPWKRVGFYTEYNHYFRMQNAEASTSLESSFYNPNWYGGIVLKF